MHINRSDPIGYQNFDNLKMWKSKILDRGHFKNRKKSDISYVQFWENFSWSCRYGLRTYRRDGKDGEDENF